MTQKKHGVVVEQTKKSKLIKKRIEFFSAHQPTLKSEFYFSSIGSLFNFLIFITNSGIINLT